MKYIEKNKKMFIAIGIFLLLVILLIPVKNALFPNTGKAIYGDRLDGIDKVKISNKTLASIEDKLKEESVTKVSSRISGKTVEIILTVSSDVSLEVAKGYGDKALEVFSDAEKKYYDFQVFITKDSESEEFPIIGYRHHSKDSITWTKDRTGSAEWKRNF